MRASSFCPPRSSSHFSARYAEITIYLVSRRGGHRISARFTECLGEVDKASRRGLHMTV